VGKEGRGTILRIRGSQYLLYLPVRVADDSMSPLRCDKTMCVSEFQALRRQACYREMEINGKPIGLEA
jgi:hypothetical protein